MKREEGFSFGFDPKACESCGGKCCMGESGYIFASVEEMKRVGEFLGISFEEMTQKYVKKVGYKFSFVEKAYNGGYACIFFDEKQGQCKIYPVRPKQCRNFPFWEIFKHQENLPYLQKECIGVHVDEEKK